MDSGQKKILLVDDSKMIRVNIARVLKSNGHSVITASDGIAALKLFNSDANKFKLILSDMLMPGMSGNDLIKEIRKKDHDVPIIIMTGSDDISNALEALDCGANDYLLKGGKLTDKITRSINKVLEKKHLENANRKLLSNLADNNRQLEMFNQNHKNTINMLTVIGTSISSERNINKLLEMIVSEAMNVTNADGGTLYILENDFLYFKIIQNVSMNMFKGGTSGEEISLPPVPLEKSNISAYCAIKKKIINIPDVYQSEGFDFSGPKKYDAITGYQTKSMLVLPMIDYYKNVIGVLQLINAKDRKTGETVVFHQNYIDIINSLASQAAVSIENTLSYEKIERKNIAFERFVPIEFLRCLGKKEAEDINLGDSSFEEMTVLFADIRNFTSISEKMTPDQNFHFLNEYLKTVGPLISKKKGFIDKFIGDAIMALFSCRETNGADNAIEAAIKIEGKLKMFNKKWKKTIKTPFTVGIGINTGLLSLGTIGFEERMETTVIGDTVNLSSRVEGLTKQYGISIAITMYTFQKLKNPKKHFIREVDTVRVKGKDKEVTIYEVSGYNSETIEGLAKDLDKYNEGLALYRDQKWNNALKIFTGLNKKNKNDRVIEIYRDRCKQYLEHPPDKSWTGVTNLEHK